MLLRSTVVFIMDPAAVTYSREFDIAGYYMGSYLLDVDVGAPTPIHILLTHGASSAF